MDESCVQGGRTLLGNQYVDLSHQEGPPQLEDVVRTFEHVQQSRDEWKQEGNLVVRVHNTLRVESSCRIHRTLLSNKWS